MCIRDSCYVGALTRDGRTFIVALLACGWPNNKTYKWKDTKKLMNYGLENYSYRSFSDEMCIRDRARYGKERCGQDEVLRMRELR